MAKVSKDGKKRILVCVAWPYVNGDLHIGHLAGYLLPADIFTRFNRLIGNDTAMVSGSDCFGTPTTIEADKEGVKPSEVVGKYHPHHLALFKKAGITFDLFTKTTTKNHEEVAQDIFIKLLGEGYITKKTTKQFYSEKDKRFLPDRYVEGTCPNCRYEGARSDQCENCGKIPDLKDLINPKSRLSGGGLELRDTEHYFLDWPKLQPSLEKYFASKRGRWKTWVQNETEGWLKKGLEPRAITRDIDWGVKIPIDRIPKDKLIDNIENKRIYVWFEAVIGYLSATIEWAKKNKRDWKEYWYPSTSSGQAEHFYFMGKDNLIFHALFWPGQLYGFNRKIHLPDVVSINQFLNLEGGKFSKSRGRIIDSQYIIDEYGVDPVRFYLTLIMPENADSNFYWDDFYEKVNGVLIANFGNFVNRTLSQFKGQELPKDTKIDTEVDSKIQNSFKKAKGSLSQSKFREYLDVILDLSSFGNKYIDSKAPWESKNKDSKEFRSSLANSVYLVLALSTIIKPLLPETSEKIEKLLGVKVENWVDVDKKLKRKLKEIKISKNIKPLFNKIDEEKIKKEKQKFSYLK